jgi:NAD(P)-dependent dehydrogenase (short-subunit alcohol dehydrogenase family)
LADRVVLITGAGNGIGAALAARLGEMGDSLALVDVDLDAATAVAERCGSSALPLAADITDMAAVENAVTAAVERFGRLDVCVANAGIATTGSLRHVDPDAFDAQFRVNAGGTFRTARAAIPALEESRGYLVLVASLSALLAPPGLGAYGATKAATETLGDVLRFELAHLGIDVGVAYFAFVSTDMVEGGERESRSFKLILDGMRWPIKRRVPVDEAVEALVRGIGNRSRRIVAPRYINTMLRLRGMLGPFVDRDMRKMAPEIDDATVRDIAERGLGGQIRGDTAGGAAAARTVGREL